MSTSNVEKFSINVNNLTTVQSSEIKPKIVPIDQNITALKELALQIGIDPETELKQYEWLLQSMLDSKLEEQWSRESTINGQQVYYNKQIHVYQKTHPNIGKFRQLFNEYLNQTCFRATYEENNILQDVNLKPDQHQPIIKFKKVVAAPSAKSKSPKSILMEDQQTTQQFQTSNLFENASKSQTRFKIMQKEMEQSRMDYECTHTKLMKEYFDTFNSELEVTKRYYMDKYGNTLLQAENNIKQLQSYINQSAYNTIKSILFLGIKNVESELFWLGRMYCSLEIAPEWDCITRTVISEITATSDTDESVEYVHVPTQRKVKVHPCFTYAQYLLNLARQKQKQYFTSQNSKTVKNFKSQFNPKQQPTNIIEPQIINQAGAADDSAKMAFFDRSGNQFIVDIQAILMEYNEQTLFKARFKLCSLEEQEAFSKLQKQSTTENDTTLITQNRTNDTQSVLQLFSITQQYDFVTDRELLEIAKQMDIDLTSNIHLLIMIEEFLRSIRKIDNFSWQFRIEELDEKSNQQKMYWYNKNTDKCSTKFPYQAELEKTLEAYNKLLQNDLSSSVNPEGILKNNLGNSDHNIESKIFTRKPNKEYMELEKKNLVNSYIRSISYKPYATFQESKQFLFQARNTNKLNNTNIQNSIKQRSLSPQSSNKLSNSQQPDRLSLTYLNGFIDQSQKANLQETPELLYREMFTIDLESYIKHIKEQDKQQEMIDSDRLQQKSEKSSKSSKKGQNQQLSQLQEYKNKHASALNLLNRTSFETGRIISILETNKLLKDAGNFKILEPKQMADAQTQPLKLLQKYKRESNQEISEENENEAEASGEEGSEQGEMQHSHLPKYISRQEIEDEEDNFYQGRKKGNLNLLNHEDQIQSENVDEHHSHSSGSSAESLRTKLKRDEEERLKVEEDARIEAERVAKEKRIQEMKQKYSSKKQVDVKVKQILEIPEPQVNRYELDVMLKKRDRKKKTTKILQERSLANLMMNGEGGMPVASIGFGQKLQQQMMQQGLNAQLKQQQYQQQLQKEQNDNNSSQSESESEDKISEQQKSKDQTALNLVLDKIYKKEQNIQQTKKQQSKIGFSSYKTQQQISLRTDAERPRPKNTAQMSQATMIAQKIKIATANDSIKRGSNIVNNSPMRINRYVRTQQEIGVGNISPVKQQQQQSTTGKQNLLDRILTKIEETAESPTQNYGQFAAQSNYLNKKFQQSTNLARKFQNIKQQKSHQTLLDTSKISLTSENSEQQMSRELAQHAQQTQQFTPSIVKTGNILQDNSLSHMNMQLQKAETENLKRRLCGIIRNYILANFDIQDKQSNNLIESEFQKKNYLKIHDELIKYIAEKTVKLKFVNDNKLKIITDKYEGEEDPILIKLQATILKRLKQIFTSFMSEEGDHYINPSLVNLQQAKLKQQHLKHNIFNAILEERDFINKSDLQFILLPNKEVRETLNIPTLPSSKIFPKIQIKSSQQEINSIADGSEQMQLENQPSQQQISLKDQFQEFQWIIQRKKRDELEKEIKLIQFLKKQSFANEGLKMASVRLQKNIFEIDRTMLEYYQTKRLDSSLQQRHVLQMANRLDLRIKFETDLFWIAYIYCLELLGNQQHKNVSMVERVIKTKLGTQALDEYFVALIKLSKFKRQLFFEHSANSKEIQQYVVINSWLEFVNKEDIYYYHNFQTLENFQQLQLKTHMQRQQYINVENESYKTFEKLIKLIEEIECSGKNKQQSLNIIKNQEKQEKGPQQVNNENKEMPVQMKSYQQLQQLDSQKNIPFGKQYTQLQTMMHIGDNYEHQLKIRKPFNQIKLPKI